MAYFHLERGRWIDISIDFVWYIGDKLDLLDKASGGTFQTRRIREGLFEARYENLVTTIELMSKDYRDRTAKFLINLSGMRVNLSAVWTFKLTRTSDGGTAVYSYIDFKPRGFTRLAFRFLKGKLHKLADEVANMLEKGAVAAFNNPTEYGIPLKVVNQLITPARAQAKKDALEYDLKALEHINMTVKADKTGTLFTVMMEGPKSSPFKLFDDVKMDAVTLNKIMEKAEFLANLANYWYSSLRGLETSGPTPDMHYHNISDELKNLGNFMFKYMIPRNVAEFVSREIVDHLLIELDPRLLNIPWELMHDGTDFLCLKCALGRRILTKEIPKMKLKQQKRVLRFLLIGDPSEELPEAQREVEILKSALEKLDVEIDIFKGREITEEEFLSALGDGNYDVIHYAGHAYFDADSPDESYLKFSDDLCHKYEIERFLGENPPSIVFVNACSSAREKGQSDIKFEREIQGLARAFVFGGCMSYVGALWPIHDDDAANLAVEFYRQIVDGHTLGDSLRRAKKTIFERSGDKSIAWASFILYGHPALKVQI